MLDLSFGLIDYIKARITAKRFIRQLRAKREKIHKTAIANLKEDGLDPDKVHTATYEFYVKDAFLEIGGLGLIQF